jgi:hypothetical protein
VDQHVRHAEAGGDVVDHRGDLSRIRHVGLERRRAGAEVGRQRLGRRASLAAVHGHACAFAREGPGGGGAKAPARAAACAGPAPPPAARATGPRGPPRGRASWSRTPLPAPATPRRTWPPA